MTQTTKRPPTREELERALKEKRAELAVLRGVPAPPGLFYDTRILPNYLSFVYLCETIYLYGYRALQES